MMSLAQIQDLADEAAAEAEELGTLPAVFTAEQIERAKAGDLKAIHIPLIGSYRPEGWELVRDLFVDKSGFGQRGEPALTLADFVKELKPGLGYATIEEGQFQMSVGEFAITSCWNCAKFAKRHYEAIAEAMQEAHREACAQGPKQWDGVGMAVQELATIFARDNGRFNRERFIAACEPGANVRARTRYAVNKCAAPRPASIPADWVKLQGLAAPFNVTNSYGERMMPGAFATFIDAMNARPGQHIPMRVMHEDHLTVGAWTRLWETPEGLMAEGFIDPRALPHVGSMRELSISWFKPGETHIALKRAMSEGRTGGRRVVPELVETRDVGMNEISLVDTGAFPGTHVEQVKE